MDTIRHLLSVRPGLLSMVRAMVCGKMPLPGIPGFPTTHRATHRSDLWMSSAVHSLMVSALGHPGSEMTCEGMNLLHSLVVLWKRSSGQWRHMTEPLTSNLSPTSENLKENWLVEKPASSKFGKSDALILYSQVIYSHITGFISTQKLNAHALILWRKMFYEF